MGFNDKALTGDRKINALIMAHHGRRRWLNLVAAFLCAINGAVTDIFCGCQVKFLNFMQDFAILQTFILRVVPSFTGFAWRRYHVVILSWHQSHHHRIL